MRALWSKAIHDAWRLLIGLIALLFVFHWVFIWVTSQIDPMAKLDFLKELPFGVAALLNVPLAKIVTPKGSIAVSYIDPVVLLAALSWGIARGSDVVAGEIGRGTMEMLLAQPVRRVQIIITQGIVTVIGAALLACSTIGGIYAGIQTVSRKFAGQEQPLADIVFASEFWPAAINLFGLTIFLAGIATLASSWESYRWRTIGLVSTVYVVSLLMKMVGRLGEGFEWLTYGSFLTCFEPHTIVLAEEGMWELTWRYTGLLLAMGLIAHVAAAVVFARRDLPAPT